MTQASRMEVLRQELAAAGLSFHVVAVNAIGAEASVDVLASQCSFDVLQDEAAVGAWSLLGGGKDDFFIYREGGRLSPGGYLPASGPVSTNLSTEEGWANVRAAIEAAVALGPGETCPDEPPPGGLQLPGDINQDSSLDISDAVSLLVHLFLGEGDALPCEGPDSTSAGNRALLDLNHDDGVDISDAVYVLNYLFIGGPPPVAGTDCLRIEGCPDACAQP